MSYNRMLYVEFVFIYWWISFYRLMLEFIYLWNNIESFKTHMQFNNRFWCVLLSGCYMWCDYESFCLLSILFSIFNHGFKYCHLWYWIIYAEWLNIWCVRVCVCVWLWARWSPGIYLWFMRSLFEHCWLMMTMMMCL